MPNIFNYAVKPDVINKTILRSFKRFHTLNFKSRAVEAGFNENEISKSQIVEYSTHFHTKMLSDLQLSGSNSGKIPILSLKEVKSFLNHIVKSCFRV